MVQPLGSTNCRTTWAECLLPMASTWVPTLPTQHLKNQLPPGQSLARPRSSLHLDRDQRCRPAPKLALSGSRPSLSLLSPALLHRTRVPGSALASPMSICLASRLRSIILKGAATSGVSRPLVRVNPPPAALGMPTRAWRGAPSSSSSASHPSQGGYLSRAGLFLSLFLFLLFFIPTFASSGPPRVEDTTAHLVVRHRRSPPHVARTSTHQLPL